MTGSESSAARPTVVIVGGGLSGFLTALHLLLQPDGPRVRLMERGGVFARGTAYSTPNPDHLLNVRVGNMSAFPDQPGNFVDWLAARGEVEAGDFVTRGCYGAYLQDLLRTATRAAPAGRFLLDTDEAVALERSGADWTVITKMGRRLEAQTVVLATGVLTPTPPPGAEPELLASPHYIADPWGGALHRAGGRVLLLGSGLTMVDAVLSLAGEGRSLTALSRRGLLPKSHAAVPPVPPVPRPEGSPAALVRLMRRQAAQGGWRSAVDSWRPYVQDIWMGWSLGERRRFLRHLRPWWDIHRHRLAPDVADRLAGLRETGDLRIEAGRLISVRLRDGAVDVTWRPRGEARERRITVDTVVNCTGFGGIEHAKDPLLSGLLGQGIAHADACGLGVAVDGRSRLLDSWGQATRDLFAVGGITRGAFWEITAAPDIRVQAGQVAADILQDLTA